MSKEEEIRQTTEEREVKAEPSSLSVPLVRNTAEPDHSRQECPLPNLCAWHRAALHLVHCPRHGNRYVDLAGPEEMCPACRVQDGSQISVEPAEDDTNPFLMALAPKWPYAREKPPYPRVRWHDDLRQDLPAYLNSVRTTINRCAEESDDPLRAAIGVAMGAASTCWTNLAGAGIFDSDRAEGLVHMLADWVREQSGVSDAKSKESQ
jgi:hypothetical protein